MIKYDLMESAGEGGCSAKLPAKELDKALADLPRIHSDKILVDIDTHDDAGVYKISDDIALIQTTDFFPPVCSDPYEFGQIAAANALSDVYAMGGKVLTAMNILMFPPDKPMSALKEIIRGGQDKVNEAEGYLVGGHTITDDIPKYGLAVSGSVHPDRLITNAGAKDGDILILTKPIGSGIIMSGKKIGEVGQDDYQAALDNMKHLNKNGAEVMQKYHIKCATDVTGFGLIGHALKLAQASKVSINIYTKDVPHLEGAFALAEMGCLPGACFRNQDYVEDFCFIDKNVVYENKMLIHDAQTSGGLLICVPAQHKDAIIQDLIESGYPRTAIIGEVIVKTEKLVNVF
ncbi:MAG: selenide, water dikinase SelD [Bacteroidales bacterium]|nr:selenide, water dikinase SelD [Bacteroidales bacterium]